MKRVSRLKIQSFIFLLGIFGFIGSVCGQSGGSDGGIRIIHLQKPINSERPELAPVKSNGELYFSSADKIYKTSNSGVEEWDVISSLLSSSNLEAMIVSNFTMNVDKSQLYLTLCTKKLNSRTCDIYRSVKIDDQWTKLTKLSINQTGKITTDPALGYAAGRQVLYFSSNRTGGLGGMDIWYSYIDKNGNFANPVNVGAQVNSIGDEISPFFCNPCQELFFSSNGHKGLGGFDVFQSAYESGKYGRPINMEEPINSSYDDRYFSISDDRSQIYFSSNRQESFVQESGQYSDDIYMFDVPGMASNAVEPKEAQKSEESMPDKAIIVNDEKQIPPVSLFFHNDTPGRRSYAETSEENYEKLYKDYSRMREEYEKMYLERAVGDEALILKNAIDNFFRDSVDAGMQKLEEYADFILQTVQQKKSITIKMQAFCSPLASEHYNLNLAKRRMASLNNYFAQYKGGVLLPYFEGEVAGVKIKVLQDFYGESKASPGVNFDPNDTRNSIYNPRAATERKIQLSIQLD